MAVRKVAINFGQSGSGPYSDIETWLPDRVDINLLTSNNSVSGAYSSPFTLPFNAPGYSGSRPIKGLAIRNIRYLNFYNPIVTGYTSYPGTGRVCNLVGQTATYNHTTTDVWVEQMFVRGTHQVASITRKTTGTTHAVTAVVEPVMVFTTNFATNAQNILLTNHGLASNDRLTLTTTAADLPAGLLTGTTYYVIVVDANTIRLSTSSGPGAAVSFSDDGTGTHSLNIGMPTNCGCRLKLATAFASPGPTFDEEFTYAIKATDTEVSEAEAQLNLNFGIRRLTTAKLTGLQLRHVASGEVRVISAWNPTTRKVTLVNKVGLASQTWSITAGDTLVIEPQSQVAWDRYCHFLPWSMFESDLTVIPGQFEKPNPYMPGFDYPGQFHAPIIYGTDAQTPTAVAGSGGVFKLTIYPYIAWHVGMMVRLSEFYGEEVYCISTDFGGTSAAHDEVAIGTETCAWYDKGQQNDWSTGRTNGCYQRWLDELDAAIAAAALEGDTLQVVAIFRNQGFADATSESDPTYGSSAAQSGIAADKFYELNKTFRTKARQAIKDRGLWPGEASEIPWIQNLEQDEAGELPSLGDPDLLAKVNTALQRLADEDPYAETFPTTGLETWDSIHIKGENLAAYEERAFDALQRILSDNDRSGEVALCNLALDQIGEKGRVTSLSPAAGPHAEKCAAMYPVARDAIWERKNWSSASRRKALLALDSDSSAWAYCYLLPGDVAKVIDLLPAEAGDDYAWAGVTDIPFQPYNRTVWAGAQWEPSARPRVAFSQEQRGDGTRVIYTDLPDAHLRYIARVTDTRRFPRQLYMAISWQLSGMLAGAIYKGSEGSQKAQECARMVEHYLGLAAEMDATQRRVRPKHVPSWLAKR